MAPGSQGESGIEIGFENPLAIVSPNDSLMSLIARTRSPKGIGGPS